MILGNKLSYDERDNLRSQNTNSYNQNKFCIMNQFIDLSHYFEDSMPGFKMKNEDGSFTQYSAQIYPFLTHEETLPKFENQCSFEITEMKFQTSVGTYLDAPFHRYPNKRDISQIELDEVILDGVVIDVGQKKPFQSIRPNVLPKNLNLRGKAILFYFGWDKYWGKEKYNSYPYISRELIKMLIVKQVKLIGVDTVNIDNSRDVTRPAHTLFLDNDILIVENLTNLSSVIGKEFRFFAVPIKAKKTAAMPIRAFAEIISN